MSRKKHLVLRKLAGVISDLDEIIASKGGKTHSDGKILKCRKRLQKLYDCLKNDRAKIEWNTVAVAICTAVKILYLWMKNQ